VKKKVLSQKTGINTKQHFRVKIRKNRVMYNFQAAGRWFQSDERYQIGELKKALHQKRCRAFWLNGTN
jgi:hypothetical protein